jgi:hypothetical protein
MAALAVGALTAVRAAAVVRKAVRMAKGRAMRSSQVWAITFGNSP